ncbi:hypothetical protein B0H14DRAFT_3649892 [Mycena olivaceomarginata]|nr:hypothetical protein B0H14DRAFT_3649892 [Mycena olivaceomarginata]
MTPALTPTNISAEEMIPDNQNPDHDPQYWCLPPTVVKAMVNKYSGGAQRGHYTLKGCIDEWQEHCALGVHPHPPRPTTAEAASIDDGSGNGNSQEFCTLNLGALSLGSTVETTSASTPSSVSSVTATTWAAVPPVARYFALWGGRIVYTDRGDAKAAFLKAEAAGTKPRILSTTDYDEAQAFSESPAASSEKEPPHYSMSSPAPAPNGTANSTCTDAQDAPRPEGPPVAPRSPRPDAPPPRHDAHITPPPPLPDAVNAPPPPLAPTVITTEKVKPLRHQKGQPKARPGKQSWVHGTKLLFFAKRKADWLRECEAKKSGQFYTKMAKLYIKKYGRHLADDQDLEFDVLDPEDSAADEVVHEVLDDTEKECRAEHLKTLRNRIGAWYRSTYGNLLKSDQDTFKDLFTGALDGAPPKPHRGRVIHFYSRMHYDTRVKHDVEKRLASLKRRSDLSGELMPRKIDVIAKVTSEMWEGETPAFQHECTVEWERDYQQRLKAWEASLTDSPTWTPEEMAA